MSQLVKVNRGKRTIQLSKACVGKQKEQRVRKNDHSLSHGSAMKSTYMIVKILNRDLKYSIVTPPDDLGFKNLGTKGRKAIPTTPLEGSL